MEAIEYQTGNTALHMASELGEKEIVELIATEENFERVFHLKNKDEQNAKEIAEAKVVD